jgi:hypothetical protein
MRMMEPVVDPEAAVQHGKERKVMHNASSKVSVVVHRMLFPLLDSPMRTHVLLDADEQQAELDLLDQVGRRNPGIMDDQQSFVQHLLGLMERYRSGYMRVPTDACDGSLRG